MNKCKSEVMCVKKNDLNLHTVIDGNIKIVGSLVKGRMKNKAVHCLQVWHDGRE